MKNKNGFTLIELLIAMAITSIVSAGIFTAFQSQQKANMAQSQGVAMQQNLRAGLYVMTRNIRMAGYDPDGLEGVGIISNGTGGVGDPLSLSYYVDFGEDGVDNDGDGVTDEPDENGEGYTLYAVSYGLSDGDDNNVADGDNDIVMTTGGNADILAENMELAPDPDNPGSDIPLFEYLDEDLAPTATLSKIRAVKITIMATPDANERLLAANRTMTTTVKCRNLGL